MTNPHEENKVTATIKHQGKDAPWLVFHGSVQGIKDNLIEAFTMSDEAKELNLHELVLDAQRMVAGSGVASSVLGGRPTRTNPSTTAAYAAAESTPAEPVVNPLFAAIEAAESGDDLKVLYSKNKAEFEATPEIMAAANARGKAIKAAAASAA